MSALQKGVVIGVESIHLQVISLLASNPVLLAATPQGIWHLKNRKPIIPLNASSKTTLQFSMDSYLFLAKCNASCLSSNKKA